MAEENEKENEEENYEPDLLSWLGMTVVNSERNLERFQGFLGDTPKETHKRVGREGQEVVAVLEAVIESSRSCRTVDLSEFR